MKKHKHYSEASFDFFKNVRTRKQNTKADPYYRDRLDTYDALIGRYYNDYDLKFSQNNLVDIAINLPTDEQGADLLAMYSYKLAPLKRLRDTILTDSNNRISNTCLNCGFGEVGSFDHYLPKVEYPQFSIHPKNLIPSCTICNSKKSTNWKNNENQTVFINRYLDDIPDIQFLFCDVISSSTNFAIKFKIDNINKIDENLYSLIESHYSKLELCQRLDETATDVISAFEVECKPFANNFANLKQHVNLSLNEFKNSFGVNNWQYVLKHSLINSPIFEKYLLLKIV